MYEILGISVVLSALLMLNACASGVAAIGWRVFGQFAIRFSARTRADLIFTTRVAAPTMAALSIIVFLIPSYLSYEPRPTSEVVSKKLAALAIVSLASLTFASGQALRSLLATRRLRKEWLAMAQRIDLPGMNIPTFSIDHGFPIIAVVGTLRPRLFIAGNVLAALSDEELAAAIAHECGHLTARDNLKRTLLRLCRDLLFLSPFGRAVDRLWAETAECAADEFAAQASPGTALNLASALVTIAKMVPAGKPKIPVAAFLVGDEVRGVKARVRRLLELASSHRFGQSGTPHSARLSPWAALLLFVAVATAAGTNHTVLASVHKVIERFVSLLS
jgi:Zn-dependent protease with chaperone function